MLVNDKELIERQLTATGETRVWFADGRQTKLMPARFVPEVAGEDRRISLNGSWRVAKWPFAASERKLAARKCDDLQWPTVQQPGKVFYYDPEENPATIEGWDRVTLAHVDPNDGALLRRKVKLPASWKGKRIYLRFDGIYPAARVYCNGKLLGEHLSGLTPVEWDVTALVRPGSTVDVAVRLLRRHKYVQMDMPRHALDFAGLSQDAFFHATEQVQIADYHLLSQVDDAMQGGSVRGEVLVRNHTAIGVHGWLRLLLANDCDTRSTSTACSVPACGEVLIPVCLEIPQVRLWNDEQPNLYSVKLQLEVPGQSEQEVTFRSGFRRFELKNQRATMNGNPVKFRGVNHLTFHPESGMYTPEPWLRQCLTLMKHANVNAIRTHFLGPRVLADLCDELGIYLLQELPVDWGHTYVHDPECLGPALMRLEGGIRRDRHHPSVVVWSIGNENLPRNEAEHDDFFNHLHIFHQFAKSLDPTRPTMFPPPGPANKIKGIFETRVGDIADIHYSFDLIREFNATDVLVNPRTWEGTMETCTRDEALARGWSGVWFSSEYGICNLIPDLLHAPYASIIADTLEDPLSGKTTMQTFIDRLREEWGYMRDDPTCLGGAYFPWLCAGAGKPWGWVRWGEDADWGIVTAELLPKPEFWALRVLFSPVQFPHRVAWQPGQMEIAFEVMNGYNSFDLSQCALRTMMGGGPPYMTMMREWQDVPMACPPGETTTLSIPLWNKHSRETLERGAPIICRCILLDPNGYRPITADILVIPAASGNADAALPVGPDAVDA